MGIKLEGFQEFEDKIEDVLQRFPEERDRFLKQSAELLIGSAKNNTPVDSGNLKRKWSRTAPMGNIIEVYNNTEYAAHVEYGHRQKKRWVPGVWKGGRFEYDPEAKTGMMLKAKRIEGARMLKNAVKEQRVAYRKNAKRILGELLK